VSAQQREADVSACAQVTSIVQLTVVLAQMVSEAVGVEKHLVALRAGESAAAVVMSLRMLLQGLLFGESLSTHVAHPRSHVGVPLHVALHVLAIFGAIAAHRALALATLNVLPHVRLDAAAQVVRLVAGVALVPLHRRVDYAVALHVYSARKLLAAHVAIVLLQCVFSSSRPSEITHHHHVGA